MSDIEETIGTDGVGGAAEETVTPPAIEAAVEEKPEEKPEPTLQEKIGDLAAKKAEKSPEKQAADAAVKAPIYTPNFKFNVLDKQHEIPKEFQALIKDEKTEKMVKEVFEKALGLESVKGKAETVRTERDNLAQENTKIKQGIDGLRTIYKGAVESGNFLKLDDFFKRLDIPQEHIMQYALAKVNLSNLPPEQQQLIQRQTEADKHAEEMRLQAETHLTDAQKSRAQLMTMQLDFALAKPDVKSIADQFDTQAGKPGAFKQQVINVGNLNFLQRGIDLTPEQAAQQVISDLGLKVQAPAAAAATVPDQQASPEKRVIVRETKTIPNIQGRSSSPLKTSPKNLDELKEISRLAQQA